MEQRIANQVDLQVTGTKSHQMTIIEKLVCLTIIHQIFKVNNKNKNFNVKKNVNISSSKILFSEKFSNPWTDPIRPRRIAILKNRFHRGNYEIREINNTLKTDSSEFFRVDIMTSDITMKSNTTKHGNKFY